MLRSKYIRKTVIFFLFFYCCELYNSFAHEGHDHSYDTTPVTIERSTYIHFKSILSVYHEIYVNLTEGQSSSVPVLAQILLDTASRGIQTESKGAGRHMMDHILQGTRRLRKAEGLQEMQEAFAIISDAIIPFFRSWPNQLNRNEIKLYQCKEHGHYWLQSQDTSPACPYTLDKSLNCSDIEEVINKK
jgi:hypothetical protein